MASSAKSDKFDLKLRAQEYSELALRTLVNIMRTGDTDRDRLAAAKEMLDRAYGRPVVYSPELEDPADEEIASNAERVTSAIASIAARVGKKEVPK